MAMGKVGGSQAWLLASGSCCDMQVSDWDRDSRIFPVWDSKGESDLLLRWEKMV